MRSVCSARVSRLSSSRSIILSISSFRFASSWVFFRSSSAFSSSNLAFSRSSMVISLSQQFWDAERKKNQKLFSKSSCWHPNLGRSGRTSVRRQCLIGLIIFFVDIQWIWKSLQKDYPCYFKLQILESWFKIYSFCVFLKDKRYTLPRWSMGSGKCWPSLGTETKKHHHAPVGLSKHWCISHFLRGTNLNLSVSTLTSQETSRKKTRQLQCWGEHILSWGWHSCAISASVNPTSPNTIQYHHR